MASRQTFDQDIISTMRTALDQAISFYPADMRTDQRKLDLAECIFTAASRGECTVDGLRRAALSGGWGSRQIGSDGGHLPRARTMLEKAEYGLIQTWENSRVAIRRKVAVDGDLRDLSAASACVGLARLLDADHVQPFRHLRCRELSPLWQGEDP